MYNEITNNPETIPLLLNLRLNKFSIKTNNILKTKKIINSLSFKKIQKLTKKTLKYKNKQNIKKILKNYLK